MGAEVTVVEIPAPDPPVEDGESPGGAALEQGIKIHTDTKVAKLAKGKDSVTATLTFKDGKSEDVTVDRVIAAVGVGNIEASGWRSSAENRPRHHRRGRLRAPTSPASTPATWRAADARPQGGA